MGYIGIIALGARLFIGETTCTERADVIVCETRIMDDAQVIAALAGPTCKLGAVEAEDFGYRVTCDGLTVAEIVEPE